MINFICRILLCFTLSITFSTNLLAESKMPMTLKVNSANLLTVTKKETNKNKFYTLDIKYPHLTGSPLTWSEERFNKIIGDMLNNELKQFEEGILNKSAVATPDNTVTISYKIMMRSIGTDPVISILFSIDAYYAGSAHPFLRHRVLTYNLATGKIYVFEDMFMPESNYRALLNHICAKKLSPITGTTRKQMVDNNELTYEVWNITPKGLLITFDNFAHALGSQQVLVPYNELNGVLSLKAMIKPCMKNPNPCR